MAIDTDITGYRVWRSTTPNFVKDNTTLCYDGPDTYLTLNVPSTDTWYYAVAAYDAFGKDGLNVSGEQSSTPLSLEANTWTLFDIVFSVDAITPNKIKWTAGTVVRNGTDTFNISAGSATWTTGYLYIYFNPLVSTTVLQKTTVLGVAVQQTAYPIATYTGGAATNIKGGTGEAFISGSQVIAGTVGASQLIAGSAVITETAQIKNGIITRAKIIDGEITNAKIGNVISSIDYSSVAHTGWTINKNGNIRTYGTFQAYDSLGRLMVSLNGIDGSFIDDLTINTASIANAAITTAKINDLAVNTLKIQDNAVTIPTGSSGYGSGATPHVNFDSQGAPVIALGTINISNLTGGDMSVMLTMGGVAVQTMGIANGFYGTISLMMKLSPPAGIVEYMVTSTDTTKHLSCSIVVLGVKK